MIIGGAALHAAGYGRVNDDGTYQVAYIGSLTASRIDTATPTARAGWTHCGASLR